MGDSEYYDYELDLVIADQCPEDLYENLQQNICSENFVEYLCDVF